MNILLINPPIRLQVEPYFQPIGLGIVAQMLRDAGHDVAILDINAFRCSQEELSELLPLREYGMIGISGLITTYKYLSFLIPLLRKVYDAPIVVGGGGITSAPQVYMNNLCPNYGVIGEGEYTAVELARYLSGDSPHWNLGDIRGLAYFENGEVVINEPRPVERDLDKFPMQAFDLMDMETYITNVRHDPVAKREVAIITSRGCPHACNFCYHIFGRGVRYRSVENVIAEMEYLIENYGVEAFEIGDELFTARKSFVMELCHEMIDRKFNVGWSAYSRVDTIDEEMLVIMKEAGCNFLGFGLESGSQKILDAMNKRTTVEKARESFLLARKYIQRVMGTLIYGYPGEDGESLNETINFLRSIRWPQGFFFLAPYPGTQVYKENLDKILKEFGNLHNFFCSLDDAGKFSINLTDFPHDEFFWMKWTIERYLQDRATEDVENYMMKGNPGLEKVVFYCKEKEKLLKRVREVAEVRAIW